MGWIWLDRHLWSTWYQPGWLGIVVLFLIFWETATLFSIAPPLTYHPTSTSVPLSLYSRHQLCVVFLTTTILTGVRWYLIVVLISTCLISNWPSVCLTWKNASSGLLPIFRGVCWVVWVLCEFWIIWCIICEYLLPYPRQPSCFIDSILHCAKAFLFDAVSFIFAVESRTWGDTSRNKIDKRLVSKMPMFCSRSFMV